MQEYLYTEEDKTNPINNYGKSKLMGEMLLKAETDNYLLFRVSWVFGEGKQNFLYKLSEWAEKNRLLKIVCDQVSIPTYTEDIVKYTILAIDKGLSGTYHLTNSGYASRYEVARYYLSKLNWNGLALPVGSNYFSAPARRPYFSAMSNKKLSDELGVKIPHWTDGIERFLRRLR
jgi:dTDP-4-dehydrorhamnose reductase